MLLPLFAQLTYVNVLCWVVRFSYYGFLINEGIGLILVIQIFHPFQPLWLYDPLLFGLLYLSHIILYETLSYHFYTQIIFTLLKLWFISN